jgi:hypothetical protein
MIVLAVGGTMIITVVTISYQVAKSAMNNPVKSLKSE